MSDERPKVAGPSTLAVHAGCDELATRPLDEPLVLSTTFEFEDAADAAHRVAGGGVGVYTRWHNPTVAAFEGKVADLEGAEEACAAASGMAAIFGALSAHLEAGDHVVCASATYAETAKLLRGRLRRFGVETTFVDATSPDAVASALTPRTRVVWLETPANPTLAIVDVSAIAERLGDRSVELIVDSTFATPIHQQPLSLGATLVVHSATKAIGGHGDAIGGVVVGGASSIERVRAELCRELGAVLSPFNAWLLSRGARTLALRAERASATALALASRLEEHAAVRGVRYPGLPSHPQHALAQRQMMRGFGAIVAFEVEGGLETGRALYDRVELISRSVSLGDVRTLLTHPASTTHQSMSPEARQAAGVDDGLLRLSVGIEDLEDLWRDLERGLS